MLSILPRNDAASLAPRQLIVKSKSGYVIADHYAAGWKGLVCINRLGPCDLFSPAREKKVVVFPEATKPSRHDLKQALRFPDSSELPVYSVLPTSGKLMHRISQVALALSSLYLVGGLVVGLAVPIGLQWVSIYYGGVSYTAGETEEIKKVIDDFKVLRQHEVDQRTQDFFAATKEARESSK